MMAQDWVKMTVGDVAQVKGGKRLPAGFAVQDEPTSHPYIRVTDMRDGGVDESDIKYVPEAAERAIRAYRIRANDIFISVAGTLGIVGRIPPRLDGANLTENADRLTDIKCDVDYLAQYLRSTPIQNEIKSISTVGAQPKLALGRIRTFEVLVPKDRAEQSRIAGALEDVDDLIESLSRLLVKKQAIKQGMMQTLLTGKTRLPGFADNPRTLRLDEVGTILTGSTPPTANRSYYGREKMFASPADLGTSKYVTQTAKRLSLAGYARSRCFPAGSTLFVCIGSTIGKTAMAKDDLTANQQINAIIPAATIDPEYLYYAATSLSSLVRIRASEQAVPLVNKSDFSEFQILVPSLREQRAIAAVLADSDEEIDVLRKRLAKAEAIKQGMMQELLTGRTRLVPQEIPG